MPKKFQTENTKAVQARARKAEAKAVEKNKLKQEKDDAEWRDDDRHLARKQQRKNDKEKKRIEDLARKNENKLLLAEEEEIVKGKPAAVKPAKLTRAQVIANQLAAQKAEAAAREQKTETHLDIKIEENVNIAVAKAKAEGIDEARNVDDAIAVLSVNEAPPKDMHPERRMKAAYNAFEEVNLPRLKAENPNLRLSQLKQMLKKDWMKSPENPLNQR